MHYMSEPHERLVKARLMAGYKTRQKAIDRFGWRYQTYAAHENGGRPFNRRVGIYAKAFKVRADWLLFGTGEPRVRGQDHPIVKLFERIPEEQQPQAINFLTFLGGAEKTEDSDG